MRPLSIAHVDAEAGWSGGEVQVFLLLEGLRARGHRAVLLCPPGSRAAAEGRARAFEVREVAMRNDLDLGAVARLAAAFRELAPDLVHLHTGRATWLGGLGARRAGRPAITTRRMDREVRRGWRTRVVYGPLPRALGGPLVRRAVAISPAVERCLLEGGVDARIVRVIASSVDPDAARPLVAREDTRRALGADDDELVLLTLASLVPRKGIDVLVDALGLLAARGAAPVAWIAGEGEQRAALEARAAGLGLGGRVRFLGRRDDARDLLAACDAFVLPARREGLGVAALEAMAAARPVVASRVGGLAEAVVDGRTGILVEPGDARALADAIERLARDPALRARLGAAGPARVAEGFLAEQMVEEYERLYREVLAEA